MTAATVSPHFSSGTPTFADTIAAEGDKFGVARATTARSCFAGVKPGNKAAIYRALVIERKINKCVN